MNKTKTIKAVLGISAFIALVGLMAYSMFTDAGKAELQKSREYNRRVTEANEHARKAQREVFCEEYRKFGTVENTPPAYKDCLSN